MNTININATDETPKVILDAENGVLEFNGRSLPEDVTIFYNPILEWLDQYAASPKSKTKAVFKLDYFNTASSKLILDILMKLSDIHEANGGSVVEWYYQDGDEDMQEAGEEFADIVEVPFELKTY